MKPEDKVPTFEQCQRLKELDVVLKTEKVFRYGKLMHWTQAMLSWPEKLPEHIIPAPDVAELGMVLDSIDPVRHWYMRRLHNDNWGLFNTMECKHSPIWIYAEPTHTEAQVRCAAIVWLI